MRLFLALLVSVATHLAILNLPTGRFSRTTLLSQVTTPASSQKTRKIEISFSHLAIEKRQTPEVPTTVQASPTALLQLESPPHTLPLLPATDETAPALDTFGPTTSSWGLPVENYLGPQELTQRPTPAEGFNPEVPELQTLSGSGKMILALYISVSGYVDRIEVESSDISEDLRKILVAQFSGTQFKPGEKNGTAVASRIRIEVSVAPLVTSKRLPAPLHSLH